MGCELNWIRMVCNGGYLVAACWEFCFCSQKISYTGYTQKNCAVSKVNKKFISHLTRAQRTSSATATIQVPHVLPAVRFSCLLRGRGASIQDGVAAVKRFLCAPFWVVQICDYSAALSFVHGLEKTHHAWWDGFYEIRLCGWEWDVTGSEYCQMLVFYGSRV